MYLLFRRSTSCLNPSGLLSSRSSSESRRVNVTEKTCLLYKFLNINSGQVRHQSSVTKTSLNKLEKKKRKSKSSRTYTDVLIVSGEKSKLKKANVTKLTPDDVNLLTITDIRLNELYKLRAFSRPTFRYSPHTYSNLAVECTNYEREIDPSQTTCDIFPELDCNPLPKVTPDTTENGVAEPDLDTPQPKPATEDAVQPNIDPNEEVDHEELELKTLTVRDSLQPEVIEDDNEHISETPKREQPDIEKSPNILKKHRSAIALKTLAAYSEVCNSLRNPQRGLLALYYQNSRARKNSAVGISRMKSSRVYWVLLKGFANKGDYVKLKEVLNIMQENKVELDLNCYTAIFECLGRKNVEQHYLKDIRIYVSDAYKNGVSFDDIMNKGIFLNDERQQVLKAFQAHNPAYTPTYYKPKVWYDNHLTNNLNDDSQLSFEPDAAAGSGHLIKPETVNSLIENQLALEEKGYITIKSIENVNTAGNEVKFFRTALNDHYKMWAETSQAAFHRELAVLAAQKSALNLEPFLRSVPVKDMVEIIVQEATKIAQGSETYSPESGLLYRMLGQKVYERYQVLRKQKTGVLTKALAIHKKYCYNYAASHVELDEVPHKEVRSNPRIQWQVLAHEECKNSVTLDMGHQPWVPSSLLAIGKFLYHIIMHDLKIDVNCLRSNSAHKNFLPAFYTIFRSQGRIVKEEVKPHPILSKLYKSSQSETLTFAANEVPMLCPPIPWTSVHLGGYIISPTDIARLPFQAYTQHKRLEQADPVQLYPNFDALNQLAAVPWKVNTKVLDVILEVFRKGGSAKLDVPEPPSAIDLPPTPTIDVKKAEKYEMFKQKLQRRRKKAEMYSLWCDCLYRLSLANHFRNDVFWLPHNMDFRGRVYPVPPHLNHLGSDLARSMLVFAESRPLGPKGLDWLKIHLINLTGLKKRDSIQDRLDYANQKMNLILDSADNPLNGKKWWSESDEPWQTLACCMEIADVVRSGIDPALYKSSFPVHQDGSCNGLQHYAALGRDTAGAFSVNLTPSELPQDVYSAVVNLVEKQRAIDEENGLEIAKTLNGFVKRKVIKQTIMTTVYGVTRFGARLQIAKQLRNIDEFPQEAVWSASSYLTGRTFDSLRSMFTSTREIQDWFSECARLISGVGGSLVEWVTPLGLPVVQPYIKYKKPQMPPGFDSFVLDQFDKPNVMKQKNAFPPNFIHSLDSSHMMLTSLHCARAGITFVSVHDCYWTHPSTIHIMNKICREQFVALHSEPILEKLSVFLYDLYAYDECNLSNDGSVSELSKKKLNRVLKRLPQTGDFDIKNVLKSIYFFS
uniref:DNA-directed RNA polymerase n=1 Tax=Dendroctonus ponderosae TaxID=77166 RepID=A0AAR5Q1A0_DENPD